MNNLAVMASESSGNLIAVRNLTERKIFSKADYCDSVKPVVFRQFPLLTERTGLITWNIKDIIFTKESNKCPINIRTCYVENRKMVIFFEQLLQKQTKFSGFSRATAQPIFSRPQSSPTKHDETTWYFIEQLKDQWTHGSTQARPCRTIYHIFLTFLVGVMGWPWISKTPAYLENLCDNTFRKIRKKCRHRLDTAYPITEVVA